MRLDVQPAGAKLDMWPIPYPFVVVPGHAALAALQALQGRHPDAVAVILGDRAEAARVFEPWAETAHAAHSKDVAGFVTEALEAANDGSGLEQLDRYRAGVEAALAASYRARGWSYGDGDDEGPPIDADGPLPIPHRAPIGLVDYRTGQFKPEVLIALLPTQDAWKAPAYLGFGGWNACPPAAVHVALARDWHAKYGARLIINTPDVIEYEISKPIQTREEALEVAWVHYRYCSDTVTQVVGSIEGLAATLKGARYWYFWWD